MYISSGCIRLFVYHAFAEPFQSAVPALLSPCPFLLPSPPAFPSTRRPPPRSQGRTLFNIRYLIWGESELPCSPYNVCGLYSFCRPSKALVWPGTTKHFSSTIFFGDLLAYKIILLSYGTCRILCVAWKNEKFGKIDFRILFLTQLLRYLII